VWKHLQVTPRNRQAGGKYRGDGVRASGARGRTKRDRDDDETKLPGSPLLEEADFVRVKVYLW
jgi:hypothetical protein